MSRAAMPTRRLLGRDFADIDAVGAAVAVAARGADAPFAYVTTPNADHLARLARMPGLGAAYDGAWLCLLDSRVVALAAGMLGLDVPRVARGADLAAVLIGGLSGSDERACIVGMAPAEVAALAARQRLAAPHHVNPPMGFWRDAAGLDAAAQFVEAHPARLVFLAVGSPGQEVLAAHLAARGRARGTGLCIGAGLSFLAGARRRAPGWMRAAGLEWLHRLAREPGRLARRYLIDDPAVFSLLWRARSGRDGRGG
jgi:exopolysaccharide biosynthesis WecB/TagA/CpsF family protein